MDSGAAEPWYRDGLYFQCRRCGNCCSGSPGYVWVTDDEITAIARYLQVAEDRFRSEYVIDVPGEGKRLTERANFDCIFYNASYGCIVYDYRPRQCRTWPFWASNLSSRDAWREAAQSCPGIGGGAHYDLERIVASAAED